MNPPRVPGVPFSTRLHRVVAAACAACAAPAAAVAACPASEPASARSITSQIDAARAAAGLSGLHPLVRIARPARAHSLDMARAQRLWHDNIRRWSKGQRGGQNVGYGPDASTVFGAMWNSPPHRDAMLSAHFHRVGVSAVRGCDGNLMVTVNFLS